MLVRWLMLVGALLGADYGLWQWSMTASSDAPALVTGLALALLAVAFAWLTVLGAVEVLLRAGRALSERRLARVGAGASAAPARPSAPEATLSAASYDAADRRPPDRMAA